jgi:hypothetical protein
LLFLPERFCSFHLPAVDHVAIAEAGLATSPHPSGTTSTRPNSLAGR